MKRIEFVNQNKFSIETEKREALKSFYNHYTETLSLSNQFSEFELFFSGISKADVENIKESMVKAQSSFSKLKIFEDNQVLENLVDSSFVYLKILIDRENSRNELKNDSLNYTSLFFSDIITEKQTFPTSNESVSNIKEVGVKNSLNGGKYRMEKVEPIEKRTDSTNLYGFFLYNSPPIYRKQSYQLIEGLNKKSDSIGILIKNIIYSPTKE